MRASPAEWDSETLGVDVGVLREWRPEWTPDGVREANRDAFEVVFVKAHGWVDPPPGAVATDHLYDMEAASEGRDDPGVRALMGAPSEAILRISDRAFADSRFLRDPKLAPRAAALYRRWCLGAEGRVLVLEDHEGDGFLVESRDDEATGRIDLVAIGGARRGRGVGTRLVAGALSRPGAPRTWRVRVSARNWRAVRFYERLGFLVRSTATAFHIWA